MEDYKKKYEEALEVIKENLNALNDVTKTGANAVNIQPIRDCFYKAFPELKKSEDERIRNEIIKFLELPHPQFVGKRHQENWIAWLEKQGEQKLLATQYLVSKGYPVNTGGDIPTYEELYEIIKEGIINVDKCEPKLKVGDWVVDNCGYTWKIEETLNQFYLLEGVEGGESHPTIEWVNKTFHLWTINDAKPGDILATKSGRPFIFKDFSDTIHPNNPTAYCGINTLDKFIIGSGKYWWDDGELYPATKEQSDLLFQKMKESGYKWENNQLEEINNKGVVDLGLPSGTLWTTCNLGAEKETDFGLFYQWGDTKGYNPDEGHDFNWDNYKWGAFGNFTKYNETDNKLVLDNDDDPVFVATNGKQKMPTKEQLQELIDHTNHEWRENFKESGVKGMKFTNKSDDTKYIFIPAAGFCGNGGHDDAGSWGCVWSAYCNEYGVDYAWNINFSVDYVGMDYFHRCDGFSVRGVLNK